MEAVTKEQKDKVLEAVKSRGGYIADITDAGPIAQETGVKSIMNVLYALCQDNVLTHSRSNSCTEVDYFILRKD